MISSGAVTPNYTNIELIEAAQRPLAPLGDQQALQHPRAGERKFQMQPVETSHDREVGFRHRAR